MRSFDRGDDRFTGTRPTGLSITRYCKQETKLLKAFDRGDALLPNTRATLLSTPIGSNQERAKEEVFSSW